MRNWPYFSLVLLPQWTVTQWVCGLTSLSSPVQYIMMLILLMIVPRRWQSCPTRGSKARVHKPTVEVTAGLHLIRSHIAESMAMSFYNVCFSQLIAVLLHPSRLLFNPQKAVACSCSRNTGIWSTLSHWFSLLLVSVIWCHSSMTSISQKVEKNILVGINVHFYTFTHIE